MTQDWGAVSLKDWKAVLARGAEIERLKADMEGHFRAAKRYMEESVRLKKERECLKGWLNHGGTCKCSFATYDTVYTGWRDGDEKDCDCGLAAALGYRGEKWVSTKP